MSLKDFLSAISEKNQYGLSIKFLKLGLPIWDNFTSKSKNLEYIDTVVGMHHKVSKKIIQRAMDIATKTINRPNSRTKKLIELKEEFIDPIVALQALDWEIPKSAQLIFYSAYNLVESLTGRKATFNGDSIIFISINQSIDAITREKIKTFEDINNLLKENK